jgi:hypothetical protein
MKPDEPSLTAGSIWVHCSPLPGMGFSYQWRPSKFPFDSVSLDSSKSDETLHNFLRGSVQCTTLGLDGRGGLPCLEPGRRAHSRKFDSHPVGVCILREDNEPDALPQLEGAHGMDRLAQELRALNETLSKPRASRRADRGEKRKAE